LCEEALRLAATPHLLMPDRPKVTGLLALILLTSARSAARADQEGALVLLADQDRSASAPPRRQAVSVCSRRMSVPARTGA
jgi:predicted RNA polymerase sigma factor